MRLFNIVEPYSSKKTYTYSIFSDLHIGSPDLNTDALKRDLQACKDKGSKVIINGDTLDLILMQDTKRAMPSHIKHEDGQINKYVEEALELLMPYVSQLCIIGTGNHEQVITKRHGVDVLAWLIERLNREKKNGKVQQGHYQNFVRISFAHPSYKYKNVANYDIFMHHLGGGNSPVTKGLIDFNRILTSNMADLYIGGHKHNNIETTYPITYITPSGTLETKDRKAIMTPSYTNPVNNGKDTAWTDSLYGRQALPGYAELCLQPYKVGEKGAAEYRIKSDVRILSNGGNPSLETPIVHPSEIISFVGSPKVR